MPIHSSLLPTLEPTVQRLTQEFDHIPTERRETIQQLTAFVRARQDVGKTAYLNFICTHNSRRSHISQLWAQAAAHYYGIANVECFSGGTEATAFNPRAVKAMQEAGFAITKQSGNDGNPVYEVLFSTNARPVIAFSKKYDDPFNRCDDFAAVMTCSHADENCPVVLGSSARIPLRYDDPKAFDDTPEESSKYRERVVEIGREILFAFSRVNP
jgi:arsenate reductase (thioredoxin)